MERVTLYNYRQHALVCCEGTRLEPGSTQVPAEGFESIRANDTWMSWVKLGWVAVERPKPLVKTEPEPEPEPEPKKRSRGRG